jgi:hypothetical protein
VTLTEKGRQTTDEALLVHLANEERLLSGLTANERKQLASLLRKLLVSESFAALDPAHPAETRPTRAGRANRR